MRNNLHNQAVRYRNLYWITLALNVAYLALLGAPPVVFRLLFSTGSVFFMMTVTCTVQCVLCRPWVLEAEPDEEGGQVSRDKGREMQLNEDYESDMS